MIDLRSDTVTVPSEEMRKVISSAAVGDDVYSEDPTVNKLHELVAELSGKEAALFMPSGCMSNQIAIKVHTNPGEEIITDGDAHVLYYETGAPALISQVMVRGIKSSDGMPDLDEVKRTIRPDVYYFPRTALLCLENTHNRHGGVILNQDYVVSAGKLAKENNMKFHLDGARLWNASAASGLSIKELCEPFDTVSLCLSKAMGAPVGSLLVGSKEDIKKAFKYRKILGGGMRQVGILAAACIYAIENNFEKLKLDHSNAKTFAKIILDSDLVTLNLDDVHTNMVRFRLPDSVIDTAFIEKCNEYGLILGALENNWIRAVFHLNISESDSIEAAEIVVKVIKDLTK